MIRRTPTRIELKLDDIAEYHNIRNANSDKDDKMSPDSPPNSWAYKLLLPNTKTVAERIGYVPQPRSPT